MRILLIEDDLLIGKGICHALKCQGYSVEWMTDGISGLEAAKQGISDFIILDLTLPKLDGIDVLKTLRSKNVTTSVLILSARDSPQDRVLGLDSGADDYLIKPFSIDELFARIRAVERRKIAGQSTNSILIGDIELNLDSMTVLFKKSPIDLQKKEFDILRKLIQNPRKIVTRAQLESELYGWSNETSSNTIDVFIHNIRKKTYPSLIKTVRGVGYCLDPDLDQYH